MSVQGMVLIFYILLNQRGFNVKIKFSGHEAWAENIITLVSSKKLTSLDIEISVKSLVRCCDKYEIYHVLIKLVEELNSK